MAIPTNFNRGTVPSGFNGYGQPFTTSNFSGVLVANTDTTIAVPLSAALGAPTATSFNKFLAVITSTPSVLPVDDVFIALNQVATVPVAPVGNVLNATSSEQLPDNYIAKLVKAGDVIHLISGGTPNVTVSFYAIQE